MKIAVLGAHGQLGRDLVPAVAGDVCRSRAPNRPRRPRRYRGRSRRHRPDVFVNCAAYNFVDKAETEPDAAMAVNAWAWRELAAACRSVGVNSFTLAPTTSSARRRPHYPFAESMAPGPVGVYGVSKLAGEYAPCRQPRELVIRTCGCMACGARAGRAGTSSRRCSDLPEKEATPGRERPVLLTELHGGYPEATVSPHPRRGTGLFHITMLARRRVRLTRNSSASRMSADLTPISSAEFGRPRTARRTAPFQRELASVGVPAPRPWGDALAAYLWSGLRAGLSFWVAGSEALDEPGEPSSRRTILGVAHRASQSL